MTAAMKISKTGRTSPTKCRCSEIMPELKEVTAWPVNGPRRRMDDLGRIAENPFPEHMLMDPTEV